MAYDDDDDAPTFADLGLGQQRHRLIAEALGLDPEITKQVTVHVEHGRGAYAEWDGRREVSAEELQKITDALRELG